MRRCFHCGKASQGQALIAVGDGEFCQACFDALLLAEGGSVESSQRVAATPPERARAAQPPGAPRATCLVCERELLGAPAVAFLGGQICQACNAEMAAELEAARAIGGGQATPQAAPVSEPAPAPLDVFTPGSGTRICAGCERPMPGPGSYRKIDGNAYCAACLPFYAKRAAQLATPLAQQPVPSSPESNCDCCRRPLPPEVQAHEGFRLCSACLQSDAELALRIARARHRHELSRLRSALESDT